MKETNNQKYCPVLISEVPSENLWFVMRYLTAHAFKVLAVEIKDVYHAVSLYQTANYLVLHKLCNKINKWIKQHIENLMNNDNFEELLKAAACSFDEIPYIPPSVQADFIAARNYVKSYLPLFFDNKCIRNMSPSLMFYILTNYKQLSASNMGKLLANWLEEDRETKEKKCNRRGKEIQNDEYNRVRKASKEEEN
eukprot:TRINITY_DN3376_c0_g4_i1.p1 TRINITY_DN3376_c0_g4~~TRINITY_DN3376_c0_g4_i1.p1  ORF type:complete len:195 (+),score=27.87 TRINITY_DN3376_c0_g4_i1:1-585(+)